MLFGTADDKRLRAWIGLQKGRLAAGSDSLRGGAQKKVAHPEEYRLEARVSDRTG